jgi:two-component system, chemotaxis family, chemotaxis protein CheY
MVDGAGGPRLELDQVKMSDGKRVLVVDDEPAIRYAVEDALSDAGYNVATAQHGAQALEEVSRMRPHVILLDLMMPVMDGWTFLRHCTDIPVVLMSASYNLRGALPREPVMGVLPKPFDLDDLIDLVAKVA